MNDNIDAQEPAEGILLQRSYGDARSYTLTCECCGPDCAHQVWVEADDTGVSVITYTTQKSRWWDLSRWKIIWTLLTRGYIEYEASIIMSKQQALNYSEVLKKSVADVERFREERIKKRQEKLNSSEIQQ